MTNNSESCSTTTGGIHNIQSCLVGWTVFFAIEITPKNPQCVIELINHTDESYKIIYGLPADSNRHGIGEGGLLKAPIEKIALLEAIDENKIIIIQNAKNDYRVHYMIEHIINKKIESLAIIPIEVDERVEWLIILDKIFPDKGFGEKEINFLREHKQLIEKKEIPRLGNGARLNENSGVATLGKILDEYAHMILNPLTSMGGFAERLKSIKDSEIDIARKYGKIISQEARRLEKEFISFNRIIKQLALNGQKPESAPLKQYLFIFKNQQYNIKDGNRLMEKNVLLITGAAKCFFEEFKKYIEETGVESGEKPIIEIEKEKRYIKLKFYNGSTSRIKKDFRWPLFNYLMQILNGKLEVKNKEYRIFLPIK